VWAKGKKTAQQGVLQGARFTAPLAQGWGSGYFA